MQGFQSAAATLRFTVAEKRLAILSADRLYLCGFFPTSFFSRGYPSWKLNIDSV